MHEVERTSSRPIKKKIIISPYKPATKDKMNGDIISKINTKLTSGVKIGLIIGQKDHQSEDNKGWHWVTLDDFDSRNAMIERDKNHLIMDINNKEDVYQIKVLFYRVIVDVAQRYTLDYLTIEFSAQTLPDNKHSILNLLKKDGFYEMIFTQVLNEKLGLNSITLNSEVYVDFNYMHDIDNQFRLTLYNRNLEIERKLDNELRELLDRIESTYTIKTFLECFKNYRFIQLSEDSYYNKIIVNNKVEEVSNNDFYFILTGRRIEEPNMEKDSQYIESLKRLDKQIYSLKYDFDTKLEKKQSNYNWKRLTSNDYKKGPEPSEWTQSYRPKQREKVNPDELLTIYSDPKDDPNSNLDIPDTMEPIANNKTKFIFPEGVTGFRGNVIIPKRHYNNSPIPAITSSNKKPLLPIIGLSILLFITIAIGVYSLFNQEDQEETFF